MKQYGFSDWIPEETMPSLINESYMPLSVYDLLRIRVEHQRTGEAAGESGSLKIDIRARQVLPWLRGDNNKFEYKTFDLNDMIMTGDCFLQHPEGKVKPVVHDFLLWREINKNTKIDKKSGGFVLPEGVYEALDAPEFTVGYSMRSAFQGLVRSEGPQKFNQEGDMNFKQYAHASANETQPYATLKRQFLESPITLLLARGDRSLLEAYVDNHINSIYQKRYKIVSPDRLYLGGVLGSDDCLDLKHELRGVDQPVMFPWILHPLGGISFAEIFQYILPSKYWNSFTIDYSNSKNLVGWKEI